MSMNLYVIEYIIGDKHKTVCVAADCRYNAQVKVSMTEPDEETIHIISTQMDNDSVFELNVKNA